MTTATEVTIEVATVDLRRALKAGPPRPSEPDCTHCGADSMDHDDDCPHGENIGGAEPTAPPHDDGEYKRTVSSRIDD